MGVAKRLEMRKVALLAVAAAAAAAVLYAAATYKLRLELVEQLVDVDEEIVGRGQFVCRWRYSCSS